MRLKVTIGLSNRIAALIVGALLVACALAVRTHSSEQPAATLEMQTPQQWSPQALGAPLRRDPIWVYNDWSAYDELSDNIPLTEDLAMKELQEVLRLRKFGVHFDYYMMDAFWFAPDGGYRTWRKPNWPDGPDRWIQACRENHILPGMWFGSNELVKINPVPAWEDSLAANGWETSFSAGGFLPDLMNILQHWYDRGIRMFEFDFADFAAATPQQTKTLTADQIREKNEGAFRGALKKFRAKHPDIVLVAFNGFGGDLESTAGPFPFRNPIDLRWLEVFDSLYAGDPRPSDVPEMNFWRSMDIYSDHMVRRYEQSFVPLERIDPTSVMFGNTGTIYYRKTHAWKGELLLMASRGGWVNTIHGNLEYLTDEDVRWFARVQKIYAPLQAEGRTKTFGGIPGDVEPYGFGSVDVDGAIYTVMNPAQAVRTIEMPLLSRVQPPLSKGRVIFRDAGFLPSLQGNNITLGPGQLAAVGFGRYAAAEYDLGVQEDVHIPRSIAPVTANFSAAEKNAVEASIHPPREGDLRIIFQQRGMDGQVLRSWPGGPPNGTSMGKVLEISAKQGDKDLPVAISYDKKIWSGLSWGAGEIKHSDFASSDPITIRCSSAEKNPVRLDARVYVVEY
ncbi:MAG: hypothetical protein ACRD8A_00085 [Candidatus Acidiferrales bacterium]